MKQPSTRMLGLAGRTSGGVGTAAPDKGGRLRFERGGQVYAIDGVVGTLRNVVVDGATGRITALAVAPRDGSPPALVPPSIVQRSAGSALFLGISRDQFEVGAARAPRYDRSLYEAADLDRLAKSGSVLELPDRGRSVLVVAPPGETPSSPPGATATTDDLMTGSGTSTALPNAPAKAGWLRRRRRATHPGSPVPDQNAAEAPGTEASTEVSE